MVTKRLQDVNSTVFTGGKDYGGEGGILATVISALSEFKGVEPLPQVAAFSAFNGDVFQTRSVTEDFETRFEA